LEHETRNTRSKEGKKKGEFAVNLSVTMLNILGGCCLAKSSSLFSLLPDPAVHGGGVLSLS
jgi:hypothetical protein